MIQQSAPGTVVLINEVPKQWVDYEIYCQLIPNTDPNLKTYKILPRIGGFEVSFKGVVSIQKLTYLLLAYIFETSFGNVASPRRCGPPCRLVDWRLPQRTRHR